MDWDTFAYKVGPTLLAVFCLAAILIPLGLAAMLFREVISPSPVVPQPARCCSCGPH